MPAVFTEAGSKSRPAPGRLITFLGAQLRDYAYYLCMKPFLCRLLVLGTLVTAVFAMADTNTTVVIPIHGMIERGLSHVVLRGIEQAEQLGAGALVIDMDTPGGKLGSAEDIVVALLKTPIPTYTFVNPRAISAGAIIAMATDKIYMTPTGLIGDAMPIMGTPFGGAQEIPEGLKEKVLSPTAALVRNAAQQKGHNPRVAEAMVRSSIELKIGEKLISPEGEILTLTSQDAGQLVGEEQVPLLSSGTVADLDAMLVLIGRSPDNVITVSVSMAERVARVIEGFPLSGVLLGLGLLGVYIEFKTPGFGFPGILGICFLAIWFWGHHIAGLAGMLELVLFTLGVILLLVEILVIPGFGLTGIAGISLMVVAMVMAMVDVIPPAPRPITPLDFAGLQGAVINLGVALIMSFVGIALLARFLPETPVFRRLALQTAVSSGKGYTASEPTGNLVGTRGVADTQLHPAGIGAFGDRRLNVVTRGAFIEKDTPIVIAEAHGSRIVVEESSS